MHYCHAHSSSFQDMTDEQRKDTCETVSARRRTIRFARSAEGKRDVVEIDIKCQKDTPVVADSQSI